MFRIGYFFCGIIPILPPESLCSNFSNKFEKLSFPLKGSNNPIKLKILTN
ncbi:hypothetical protein GFO_1932 [Christiangramia forsetii KT0803]|uniref:Uncharacterized protein n=1 Tax=Christiangramia forsetii (strain DSM 17595 / CGMCC 1.15422 / KT0803) TaxID=411154 RepID=A0M2Q2_CHRFK|nr:hypothetical protein GFO_1932 [Christiangramia forsetii KT0803]